MKNVRRVSNTKNYQVDVCIISIRITNRVKIWYYPVLIIYQNFRIPWDFRTLLENYLNVQMIDHISEKCQMVNTNVFLVIMAGIIQWQPNNAYNLVQWAQSTTNQTISAKTVKCMSTPTPQTSTSRANKTIKNGTNKTKKTNNPNPTLNIVQSSSLIWKMENAWIVKARPHCMMSRKMNVLIVEEGDTMMERGGFVERLGLLMLPVWREWWPIYFDLKFGCKFTKIYYHHIISYPIHTNKHNWRDNQYTA